MAQAGGLYLYEVGTPDVGLAAAGYAARAQDASTAITNPAGMTRLELPELLMGAQPMYLHFDFSPDANTSSEAGTLPGGVAADEGDRNGWLPAGGLFYVHPVGEKLAFGLAVAGYFGLSLDYQDDWVGRAGCNPAGGRGTAHCGLAGERLTLGRSGGGGALRRSGRGGGGQQRRRRSSGR